MGESRVSKAVESAGRSETFPRTFFSTAAAEKDVIDS